MLDNNQKTILITGGSGFIGSHITSWLFELNYKIIIVDKFYENTAFGTSKYLIYYYNKLSALNKEKFEKNVIYISFNLGKEPIQNLIDSLYERNIISLDLCIHLASVVGVNNVLTGNTPTYDSLKINLDIYEFTARMAKSLLFASTSEIYGENTKIDNYSHANIPTINISNRGGYAAQKLASEFMFNELPDTINFKTIRFFNITGPGQELSSGMVIPKLINEISKNNAIIINKKMKRVFTWINHIDIKTNILTIINNLLLGMEDDTEVSINIGLTLSTYFKEPVKNILNLDTIVSVINDTINELENKPQKKYDTNKITKVTKFYAAEINKRLLYTNDFDKENNTTVDFNYKIYLKELVSEIYLYNKSLI